MLDLSRYIKAVQRVNTVHQSGRIIAVHSPLIEASGCSVSFGELVQITTPNSSRVVQAEVVGLKQDRFLLMPFSEVQGLDLNGIVVPTGEQLTINVSEEMLGRVVSPLGLPLDDGPPLPLSERIPCSGSAINPLVRQPIKDKMTTGVKAIDVFTPMGIGQRLGIFAGSGVGKSTLLGMVSRYSSADITVVALVGERGREVVDFINESLGKEGLAKTVVVVATAGDPAIMRKQAAYTATAIAEWFREKGNNVFLIMDSITRFAMAQREIGLSVGESVGARGYPSSVFSSIPPLVERCGNFNQGSITALYTVLVEGDDFNEPVSDSMRSILDGHIILSRDLAERGHFPAIDVPSSISRLGSKILNRDEQVMSGKIRTLIADYYESKEMIELGLYKRGANPALDASVSLKSEIDQLLVQSSSEHVSPKSTWAFAGKIAKES